MKHTNSTTGSDPLWTRSFTTLILGSVVTMLGHAISSFAISLLVLDYTGSVFLYSLYLAAYFIPQVIVPLFAGPWMDNFSRVKVIYGMDFLAAALYLLGGIMMSRGWFSYGPFLVAVIFLGTIDSIYLVAYDSLFPNLISAGNYSRGYAVSSMLYPLAAMMTPVASLVYEKVGVAPLFYADAALFLIAALFEIRIKAPEHYREGKDGDRSARYLLGELREGIRYIRSEPGLLVITSYFFCSSLCGSGCGSLWLPYFRATPALGVMAYTVINAFNVGGRFFGGLAQYRIHYPAKKKLRIALFVYISISFIEGGVLFAPKVLMAVLMFCTGLLAVNSYNIRISTTQSYVPDKYRGRFNGCFQMFTQAGTVIGQLSAGALGEFLPLRPLALGYQLVNLVCCLLIMVRGRKYVEGIYNRDV